ncbi:hypothetical protein M8494_32095 [Serratia ureilytica]
MNTGTLLRALANALIPTPASCWGRLRRPVRRRLSACCSRWPTSSTVKPNCRKSPADAGGEAAEESGRGPAGQYLLPLGRKKKNCGCVESHAWPGRRWKR